MSKYIFILFALILMGELNAQNIGLDGDTLVNYTDINGLKQGNWHKEYPNGKLMYEAYFMDNKPVGNLKRYDKNGDLFAILVYRENCDTARAKIFHSNAKIAATGNYIDKNKDSIWNYFSENGTCYLQEAYRNGLKHGTFKNFTSQKILVEEVNYVDGVRDGSWKRYFVDGNIMWEATYVKGKLQGEIKTYYRSGAVHKNGMFKDDLMEGAWLVYTENGSLIKTYHYDHGKSPEAEKEDDEMMREIIDNKDKFDGPKDANDIDWLRGKSRY